MIYIQRHLLTDEHHQTIDCVAEVYRVMVQIIRAVIGPADHANNRSKASRNPDGMVAGKWILLFAVKVIVSAE